MPPNDDRVGKVELQYLLANKVSIQEISRILENKANVHDFNDKVKQIDDRVQHMYEDIIKKTQSFALQKDLNYLGTLVELKANTSDVNESLQQKASKSSV